MAVCVECGKGFVGRRYDAEACSGPCRRAWHNRRQARGVELYDAIMACRGNPEHQAKAVDRLTTAYLAADKLRRGGRRSWQTPQKAALGRPLVYGVEGDRR